MQVRKITKNLTRLYLTFILQSNKNIIAEKFYVLPRSYYHYIVDIDNAEQIHSHAEYAIKKLFSNYTLLVIQSTGTIWSGLEEI
ncbi:hypothetical protein M2254_001966 [Chryseobacterium sp. BIGb0186]|nr:hypothetical protein [Chryseobacterium sp. JUb44]MDH6210382.1 hypothetical protein [Chryseobacterium sp. BIGb0186]